MLACSVSGCGSRSDKTEPGITFHRIPIDETRQRAWLASINRMNWKPPKGSVICSLHFDESALIRKRRTTELAKDATPTKLIPPKKLKATPKLKMQVCLGCLSHDSKMFSLQAEDLLYYQRLFGETSLDEPQTSQLMCWECMASLKKVTHFSKQCLRAKNALVSLKDKLSPQVLSQARQILNLESNLTTILIQPMVHFETVKEEFEETSIQSSPNEGKRRKIEENSFNTEGVKVEISEESEASHFTDVEYLESDEDIINIEQERMQEVKTKIMKGKVSKKPLVYKSKAWHKQRKKELRKSFNFIGLTQEEMALSMMKKRKETEKSKTPYKCQLCFKVFKTEKTYTNHWKLSHDETIGKYVCDVCGARRKGRKALYNHLRRSHMYEFRCKLCSFTAPHLLHAWNHKLLHEGVTYVCEFCGKVSKHMHVHFAHLQNSHNTNTHHCLCCGLNFSSKQGLFVHVNKSSSCKLDIDVTKLETRQHCEKCNVTFANEQAISKHRRILHEWRRRNRKGNGGLIAQLKDEPEIYTRPKAYKPRKKRTNFRYKNDTVEYPCEECGRIYVGERNYKIHLRVHNPTPHTNLRRFYCQECDKYFSTSYSHRMHDIAIHQAERPMWPCKECDKVYKTPGSLLVHVRSIHRELKYTCYHCGREYLRSSSLHYHIQTSHMNKKFPRRDRSKKSSQDAVDVTEYLEITVK